MKFGQYLYDSTYSYLSDTGYDFGTSYTIEENKIVFTLASGTISKNSHLFFTIKIPSFAENKNVFIKLANDTKEQVITFYTLPITTQYVNSAVLSFGAIPTEDYTKLIIDFSTPVTLTEGMDFNIMKSKFVNNILQGNSNLNQSVAKGLKKIAFEGNPNTVIMLNNTTSRIGNNGVLELLNVKIFKNVVTPFLGIALDNTVPSANKTFKINFQYEEA